jgi:hypothetical protein
MEEVVEGVEGEEEAGLVGEDEEEVDETITTTTLLQARIRIRMRVVEEEEVVEEDAVVVTVTVTVTDPTLLLPNRNLRHRKMERKEQRSLPFPNRIEFGLPRF